MFKKNELKSMGHFHRVDPADLFGLEEWVEWLEAILHGPCSVIEKGDESFLIELKHEVDRLGGLKVEIRSDEHPPPHFHVISPEVNASFAIEDGRKLHGVASPSAIKKIKHWHSKSKNLLIEHWNAARPTECTVGNFRI